MSGYLAFYVPLSTEGSLGDVLAPAFRGGFFRPVAMGAIERHAAGDHWFLAGYALEHFLAAARTSGTSPLASISLLTTQDAEQYAYQEQCAHALRQSTPWNKLYSPFARVEPQLGMTVLEPQHLTGEALGALTHWTDHYRQATVEVYGALALSLRKPAGSTWTWGFQEVVPEEEDQSASPVPFLSLHLYTADRIVGRLLVIRTLARVWLRQAQALGRHVSPENADVNLQELASFTRALTWGKRSGQHGAAIYLEGDAYTLEETRIRAAFQDLL